MYVFVLMSAGVSLMYLATAFIEDFLKITKSFSFGMSLFMEHLHWLLSEGLFISL